MKVWVVSCLRCLDPRCGTRTWIFEDELEARRFSDALQKAKCSWNGVTQIRVDGVDVHPHNEPFDLKDVHDPLEDE